MICWNVSYWNFRFGIKNEKGNICISMSVVTIKEVIYTPAPKLSKCPIKAYQSRDFWFRCLGSDVHFAFEIRYWLGWTIKWKRLGCVSVFYQCGSVSVYRYEWVSIFIRCRQDDGCGSARTDANASCAARHWFVTGCWVTRSDLSTDSYVDMIDIQVISKQGFEKLHLPSIETGRGNDFSRPLTRMPKNSGENS